MVKVGVAEYDVIMPKAALEAEVAATSRQIEAGLGSSARAVGSDFAKAAKVAVGAFALLKGAHFARDVTQEAAQTAQQQQRANVEFGKAVDLVDEFSEHSAKAYGVSRRDALQAASGFGTLFHTIGLGSKVSAEWSTNLVGIAADLASLHGTDVDTALKAIQGGLVGMSRGLRRTFGIDVSAAVLKQEALRLGLYSGKGALDASAKAQAAYSLILKQTTDVQGSTSRLSDQAAVKQRKLNAEWADAKDKLGEKLLPVMKDFETVGTDVLELFEAMPVPVQETLLGLTALGVVLPALKGGFGLLASAGKGAFGSLRSTGAAAGAAEDAAASVAASNAFIAEQAAADGLVASLRLVGASEAEIAIATGEAAAAADVAAAATEAEATASVGLMAALGPVGIALGIAAAAYAAFTLSSQKGDITGNVGVLVGATQKQLLELAGVVEKFEGESGFEKIGFKSLPALRAMRDAVKKAGGDTSDLDTAIRRVEATNERAARAEKKYGDAVGGTTGKSAAAAQAAEDLAAVRKGLFQGAVDAFVKERDIENAKLHEQDTSKSLVQAIADEATARRAATGDSDEYRAAVAAIADAKKAETAADKEVTTAERALTDAREQARRSLRDQRLENERNIVSAERAKFALADSQDALAQVQDDPRSTDRQKAEALLDVKDAQLSLEEAQNRRGDSAADLAKADAAGVEGSDAVTAAKERVTTALDGQREAEQRTAEASKAAAKVLSDAKAAVATAADKTRQAVLDEADAHAAVAEKAYGAAAGNYAFLQSLLHSVQVLDPAGPLRTEIANYIADLEALKTAQDVAGLGLPGGTPSAGHTTAPDELPSRPQGTPHAPGTAGRILQGPTKTVNVGQINVTKSGASAKDISDELAFGGH